jgi:hypothetical protein
MSKKIWSDEDSYSPTEDILSEEEAEAIHVKTMAEMEQTMSEEYKEESSQEDHIVEQFEQAVDEETYTEEELEEDPELIFNARMRLEQGRLYEMLLNHNLFEGTSAHPKAVANVERELKSFIRTRLEVLLGLKPDPKIVPQKQQAVAVQLPFNELEITLLKQVLSKMTKGATEQAESKPEQKPVEEKKQAIKPLSIAPVPPPAPKKEPVKITVKKPVATFVQKIAAPKPQAQKVAPKAQPKTQPAPPPLNKSPYKMSASELMERNKYISERQKRAKAEVPEHLKMPMPDADQLALVYSQRMASISPVIEKIIKHLPNSDQE